jgi:hypothetical protein
LTSAELLVAAMGELLDTIPDGAPIGSAVPAEAIPGEAAPRDGAPGQAAPHDGAPGQAAPGDATLARSRPDQAPDDDALVPFAEWRRERGRALATAARARTLAATALTDDGRPDVLDDPGLHKRPRDLDLPPWQKGRYGTAIGRAVHGALQTIDLTTGAGTAQAVAAQAAAEGVTGHEPHIRSLVEGALRSPTVVEAARSAHWREVYVGVPLIDDPGGPSAGRTLEGYVDLLYRRGDGLVVVDYKTGPASLDADLRSLVERYRMQGASYALAVAAATGEPVVDVVFVFVTPEGPVERTLPNLRAATAEARRLALSDDERLAMT